MGAENQKHRRKMLYRRDDVVEVMKNSNHGWWETESEESRETQKRENAGSSRKSRRKGANHSNGRESTLSLGGREGLSSEELYCFLPISESQSTFPWVPLTTGHKAEIPVSLIPKITLPGVPWGSLALNPKNLALSLLSEFSIHLRNRTLNHKWTNLQHIEHYETNIFLLYQINTFSKN